MNTIESTQPSALDSPKNDAYTYLSQTLKTIFKDEDEFFKIQHCIDVAESIFPGGLEAAKTFVEKIKKHFQSKKDPAIYFHAFCEGSLTLKFDIDFLLKIIDECLEKIPTSIYTLLDPKYYSRKVKKLLCQDPQAFREMIDFAIKTNERISRKLALLEENGDISQIDDWNDIKSPKSDYVFSDIVGHYGDPNLDVSHKEIERAIDELMLMKQRELNTNTVGATLDCVHDFFLVEDNGRLPEVNHHGIVDLMMEIVMKQWKGEGMELFMQMVKKMTDLEEIRVIASQIPYPYPELENFDFGSDVSTAIAKIKEIKKIRHALKNLVLDPTESLPQVNNVTNAAIRANALLVALGLHDHEGMEDQNGLLPQEKKIEIQEQLANGEYTGFLQLFTLQNRRVLVEKIRMISSRLMYLIQKARMQSVGLMPIGAKIHFSSRGDGAPLKALCDLFNINQTSFRLIHANDCLILPPQLCAAEHYIIFNMLEKFGILPKEDETNRYPAEIQTCVAGRWLPDIAALVGSTMLLATQRGVKYSPGAFSTDAHDNVTGARIMAYDGGVRDNGFPFDRPDAEGRTDMLGRRVVNDLDLYQVLGTLAVNLQYGGYFEKEAEKFRMKILQVLGSNNFLHTVFQSAWVEQHASPYDTLKNHEDMIGKLTDRWQTDYNLGPEHHYGIIGEVRDVLHDVRLDMIQKVPEMMNDHPETVKELINH